MSKAAPKKNYKPMIKESPQSFEACMAEARHGVPANRFEKFHVDVTDTAVVDPIAALEERPRRATQFFRDGTQSIITRNKVRMWDLKRASIPIAAASMAAFIVTRGRRTNISASRPGSISKVASW